MPSRRSSDRTARRQAWSSTSMAASSDRSAPTSRAHLAMRTAVGALAAISAARAVAAASDLGPGHDPVGQADPPGLGRRDPAAGEHQVPGHRPAHPAGQQLGAATGRDQAEADLGQPEGGVVGRDHQVAGQGQLGPAPEGEAEHRRHRRQRAAADRREPAAEHLPLHEPAVVVEAGPLLEVGPDAEGPLARPGQHHRPDPGVGAQRLHGRRPGRRPARSRSRSAPPAGPG